MNFDQLSSGENPPENCHVIIEIPVNSDPVKYEFDKKSGFIFVDRLLNTAMHYPCNYGFIPQTLAEDGDPVDALVVSELPIISGAVIKCRPVGVLLMEDEAGMDEKLICVPIDKISPQYASIHEPSDLPEVLLKRIAHFFEHYKDLEPSKWTNIKGIEGSQTAKELVIKGIHAYQNAHK